MDRFYVAYAHSVALLFATFFYISLITQTLSLLTNPRSPWVGVISSGKYFFLGCRFLFVTVMATLAAHIAKRFLIIGVTAAAVRTRIQFDRPCTIGGDLSRNFRKLLLGIVAVNFLRLVLSGSRTLKDSSGLFVDLLGVVEVTGLTFLCFLTPYIMETRLRNYISVPRPGRNFYGPLLGSVFLSCLGVVLSRSVHPNLWCLKKLANAISGPPVITVLQSWNRVTTAQSGGNGFVIGQTFLTIEYWHLILQLACAAGYAFESHVTDPSEMTGMDAMLEASRSVAFFADWTRVLIHALFLNIIDEMGHLHVFDDQQDRPQVFDLARA